MLAGGGEGSIKCGGAGTAWSACVPLSPHARMRVHLCVCVSRMLVGEVFVGTTEEEATAAVDAQLAVRVSADARRHPR